MMKTLELLDGTSIASFPVDWSVTDRMPALWELIE